MSLKPFTSKPTEDIVSRKEVDKTTLPNRPTYTPNNASQFVGVFNKMIETQMNQEIHESESGLKVNTLYIKANDALKWLAENHPTEADKYALLKSRVSITRRDDRIVIYWKTSAVNIINQNTASISSISSQISWKDDFTKWLETAQDGEIYSKEDISISKDDKTWLLNILSGLGPSVEVDITLNSVRVMR